MEELFIFYKPVKLVDFFVAYVKFISMLHRRVVLLACLAISFIPCAFADAPGSSAPADNFNSALGQVQFSAYGSTNKSEQGLFTMDFIVPLYYPSSKDTLLYFNPKDTYSTPDANETHLGLGLRHIFDDSFILGINSFFDRRQDHSDAWFSQAGVGLEYLSHPLDMRLNWYKPTTGVKTVNTTYGFGETGLIQYGQKEEPLQGLDFEVGVPVFDKYTKTRMYVGGYFYQSRLSKDVNGMRVRTETSLTKWLSLDTTFNSNVGGNKNEFYGGLRVTVAFDLSNLFNKTGKPVFSAPAISNSKDTYLEDRLFERVVRDIDIQSKTSTAVTNPNAQSLVYVNGAAAAGGNGTLGNPYNTIPAGVAAASSGGQWVYVEGKDTTTTPYAANLTLPNGITLWGSGYNGGFNGLPVSGVYPIIDGGSSTPYGITLGNNNTVMGMQITGTTSAGIYSNSANNANISYNIVSNNSRNGIELDQSSGDLNAILNGNTVNSNRDGIYLNTTGGGNITATLNGNMVSCNSSVGIGLSSGSAITATIAGNQVNNNDDGIVLVSDGDMTVTLTGNETNNNFGLSGLGGGIVLLSGGGTMTASLSNNIANYNNSFGILIFGFGSNVDASFSNNTVNGNGMGIGIVALGNVDATLSNNIANDNNGSGILVEGISGEHFNVTLSKNTINSNDSDGISLETNDILGATLTDNIITNNSGYGVDIGANGGTINLGNALTGQGGDNSIYGNNNGDLYNGSGTTITAQNNWWGTTDDATIQSHIYFGAGVTYSPYLSLDPNS